MAIEKRKEDKLRNLILTKKRDAKSEGIAYDERYNRLAEIKLQIEKLEMEYSSIFSSLESSKEGLLCSVKTPYGKLGLQIRVVWKAISMNKVFTLLGKVKFLENCSISKTGIMNAVGEIGFEKLKEAKAVEVSSTSKFYKLTKVDSPKE